MATDGPKNDSFKVEDMDQLCVLGSGSFGRVILVKHKATGDYLALKMITKRHVVQKDMIKYVNQEKDLMEMCAGSKKHPFIVQLHGACMDDTYLYLCLEALLGGEMYHLIERECPMKADIARNYFIMVASAVEFLHSKQIIYRDLKPENMMLGADGYIRLIDFGLSKYCTSKTFTICGTTEYMAPEIVLGTGHGRAVDIWGLGIFLYELLVGYTPFNPRNELDQLEVCKNIVEGKISFKCGVTLMRDPTDLITRLLQRDQKKRLGMSGDGFYEIREHPWFDRCPWKGIEEKKVQLHYVPRAPDIRRVKIPPDREGRFDGDDSLFEEWAAK